MPARIGQNFGVGRMVGILDGDYGTPQLRMFVTQIGRKLLLAPCRADDENFVGTVEGMRDVIKKLTIGGRPMAPVCALAAVYTLMLIMSPDHAALLFGRGEVPSGRLLMIDPNYSMVM